MHCNRNAQHGCHCNHIRTHMTIAERTMICTPMIHHFIHAGKGTLASEPWCKPCCGPSWVSSDIQLMMHFFRQITSPALCNMQNWAKAMNQIQTQHGNWHSSLCEEVCRITAPAGNNPDLHISTELPLRNLLPLFR